ncbi:MAG: hypothetical protein U9R69_01325, partial [Thermodesulfobacteriota bacterium]|nr:hypothetical protein [Thermodesulfobacteriota bacterium]
MNKDIDKTKEQLIAELEELRDSSKKGEESLHHRDNYLSALNHANDILFAGNFDEQLSEFVKIVGKLSQASRTYIFKNHTDETGSLLLSQIAEYVAPGIKPEIGNP